MSDDGPGEKDSVIGRYMIGSYQDRAVMRDVAAPLDDKPVQA